VGAASISSGSVLLGLRSGSSLARGGLDIDSALRLDRHLPENPYNLVGCGRLC
jgi:hypothetical protein